MSESSSGAVAIIGMSLRFPKADTPERFWANLVEGRDCARVLDKEELRRLGVSDDRLDSQDYVYRAYDLDNVDQFDARFFGLSPREAKLADPQLRISLECAQECIEDSGHVLQGTNTGMYFGIADSKYWLYYNLIQSPLEEQNEVAKRIVTVKDFFPTQLSHKLDLAGPSISLSSACSTGLLATHEACNHLLMYDCDFAIAGGCEILTNVGYKYQEGGLSSRDGYIRAFDKDASGTVFGCGVGMVMLRRLEDALADGDRIYAVIRSTAVNNDGSQKVGYMAPGVKGQMGVIREAIERAGVSARDISYVEAHGTGTPVGDPIEIESIGKVYRNYTSDNQYCAIGSVKTNVGHLSIAAGVAGLIKTSLMLHHKKIPPILHFKQANPAIDFERSPFYVSRALQDWQPYNGNRIAGISAFGVGGTNAHAIVEEAPVQPRKGDVTPYQKLFVFSAKSAPALKEMTHRLAEHLQRHPDIDLADVAYTLAVGRQSFDHRLAFVADGRDALLAACLKPPHAVQVVPGNTARQLVFMFPGQGAQYAHMAHELWRDEPVFRRWVDECCAIVQRSEGIDVRSVLFPSDDSTEAERSLIHQTQYTQVCLFVVSYALARLWMHWGVQPAALIGHSIGEYAAACVGGVFSLVDALKLVVHRGRLMQSMPKGSMLSVPLARNELLAYLDPGVSIAGENSPAACVVSGTDEAIQGLSERLARAGIKSSVLMTSHAFHSQMMDPMLAAYERIVRSVQLRPSDIPVVSNLTGDWLSAEQAADPRYWVSQLREAVLFSKGVQTILTQDSIFLELGPGATLCALLGQHEVDHACLTVGTLPRAKDKLNSTDFILDALGKVYALGADIAWNQVHSAGRGQRVSLPTYPFERKSYWIDEETLNNTPGAGTVIDKRPLEHPLLGRKIAVSAKVVAFENLIDAQTPRFVADHRLVETVIFPGAGYAQMGLEIGKYFIKNKKVRIDEIRFAQTMMLHEGTRKVVQVIATANGEGCTFEILSRNQDKSDPGDAAAWVLHAKGRVSPHSANAPTVELPALVHQAGSELVPLSRYYDALKFITFGPSFRAVQRLWIGENAQGQLESVGLVELPPHLYPEVDRYSFHPVLLDAAFQVIDGPKVSQTGTLPVGLRGFTVYEAVPNTFYVHAVRRTDVEEEYSIGEITIFSLTGVVIARIEHYLQKEISDAAATVDRLSGMLFSIAWEAVAPAVLPSRRDGKTWIVIGAEDRLNARVQAALRTQGQTVLAESPGRLSHDALALIARSEVGSIVFVAPEATALTLSQQLLKAVQAVGGCDADTPPRLVIVTAGAQEVQGDLLQSESGPEQAALWGLGNSLTAEHPEFACLRADLDDSEESLAQLVTDLLGGDTLENQLAYRQGQRHTPRLVPHGSGAAARSRLRLPSGPFEIRLMRFGSFDNFAVREFVPDMLAENEALVEMHSAALNFKETLWALGYLNPNKRHAANFDFGMEGSGRIKRVGSKVTHLKAGDEVIVWHNGCLSSDFVVNVDKLIKKPKSLSHAAAACIPTVFMTAYYALYHLAKIKRGDKILIHAAAGGVGQVAIQIAKAAGAEIYATASRTKWDHLRQQGVRHVFDSRSLDFSAQILELTKGKGVDIVFNSLTGDFIPRSFDTLTASGCFVEIGKKDVWTHDKAHAYRPDVDYQVFELGDDKVSGGIGGSTIIHELMVQILEDFEAGQLVPLPMTEFDIAEVQQGYRYLATAKNIGKVVVNFDIRRGHSARRPLVDPDKTYLVTGGLGGLGFLTAEWLVAQGARHLALTGRREPDEATARKIGDFNKIGLNVRVLRGDVGEYEDVQRIIQTIQAGMAPLGGVMHCAGVLDDALVEQQSAERFEKVFKPKVAGALHLHQLTQHIALDFFVCYSSVSAILDGGGQSNYAAANTYMDRLMKHRRNLNLPGLSVNWGAWADVGMAAQLAERRAMDKANFIAGDQAFLALERLMLGGDTQGVVCQLGNRLASETRSRLLLNLVQPSAGAETEIGDLDRIFQQHPSNSAEQNFELFLKLQVNKVLGADAADQIDTDAEFVALGVDSLSMTELKNAVQQGMGKPLKMATFFANPSVARLARHLAREYKPAAEGTPGAAAIRPTATALPERASGIDFVALDDSKNEQLIFCFPGLNGNIFDFADFAAEGRDRYKVMAGEISSDVDTLETDIRKLAADAIARMRALQPSGPYALLGYSYGGVVALELAHQLRSAGEDVQMLMMIDSFPHFHLKHDARFMNFMSALITDSILAPLKLDDREYDKLALQIMGTPAERLPELLAQLGDEPGSAGRVSLDLLRNIIEVGKQRSLASYEPPREVAGLTINYVRAGKLPRSMALADLGGFLNEPSMCDEKYSWSRFVGGEFEVHRVQAQHNEILKSEHAKTILGFVDQLMARNHQLS